MKILVTFKKFNTRIQHKPTFTYLREKVSTEIKAVKPTALAGVGKRGLKRQLINNEIIIHIKATFNNTMLTLTDFQGQVLTWASAGSCGFKGARKGTPFAAKKVVDIFLKKSIDYLSRCNQIKIYVCGVGPGRENALRGFEKITDFSKQEKRMRNKITLIREITKIPHNGCRPPKKRRL